MTAPRMDAVRTGMAAANASRIDGHVSPDCQENLRTLCHDCHVTRRTWEAS